MRNFFLNVTENYEAEVAKCGIYNFNDSSLPTGHSKMTVKECVFRKVIFLIDQCFTIRKVTASAINETEKVNVFPSSRGDRLFSRGKGEFFPAIGVTNYSSTC